MAHPNLLERPLMGRNICEDLWGLIWTNLILNHGLPLRAAARRSVVLHRLYVRRWSGRKRDADSFVSERESEPYTIKWEHLRHEDVPCMTPFYMDGKVYY